MPSLAIRQSHSFAPSIPSSPKQSPSIPVRVDKSIDSRVFIELFAGTIGIFLLAVWFWKLGSFIRRFNRNKVLKAGKSTDTRYARTWYGWVSRPTHERNKQVVRDFIARIWDCMAWKSTRDDYSWVWWDPGDIERQKRQRQKRGLWWLPECFKSYEDFPTADQIWNPCAQARCHGGLDEGALPPVTLISETAQVSQASTNAHSLPSVQQIMVPGSKPIITRSILEELYRDPQEPSDNRSEHPHFRSPSVARSAARPSLTHVRIQSLPFRQRQSLHTRGSIPWSRDGVTQDILCQVDSVVQHAEYQVGRADPMLPLQPPNTKRPDRQGHRQRYCGWSARMQLGSRSESLHHQGDSSGPPGTPMTELLASYPSDESSSAGRPPKQIGNNKGGGLRISKDRISFTSTVIIDNEIVFANQGRTCTRTFQWNSAPARVGPQVHGKSPPRPTLDEEWLSICGQERIRGEGHFSLPRSKGKAPEPKALLVPTGQIQIKTGDTVKGLSDWEVRLLEKLDRKLVWVFNEFTPGQKPYHFALLANHWINRETWIVYDPISRVPTNARREWGDPRFNVPYPEPVLAPRPKYPVSKRRRAHTPRIDSWRATVNEHRKVSGVRETIRTITLYEESAEEPPDGQIDPASWALPRPPQGFQMSATQKNAWYEGGAGWQEKLNDWQQVHRGYRIHKALHEGRVNRGKVKQVVSQMNRTCRPVVGKFISSLDVNSIRGSPALVS
ncbi:hypothetical protein N7452_008118 [Penicillium brevicompactum]|uniref:Uncharacterized protein n=1 Tax=Penicillium brevicompactum TaxID=5074 RepID=A0A9W9Q992_PENBR|nr:hypothetical protein N7452_008118 [Penicillium brevicompactum]